MTKATHHKRNSNVGGNAWGQVKKKGMYTMPLFADNLLILH
jgi:hypothetical protein